MRLITCTADDRRALAQDRYHHPDPRLQRQMEVLWLQSHGLPHHRIAASAEVSRRSVPRDLDQSLEGGLEGRRRGPWPHPERALAQHETSLEEDFREHPPRSAKQARAVLEQRTGLRRGLTPVRHFLQDRRGLRGRQTGAIPVPPQKTIPEHAREQATFVREEPEPHLKQARRGRRPVYFVEAAQFVCALFLGWLWCATQRLVRAASGRKRSNVLRALDAVTHRLIGVTNHESIHAESVCVRWHAVAAAAVGLPITLVLDNARYQKCAVVQAGAGVVAGDRTVGPAGRLTQPEPDRAAVAVRAPGVPGFESYEDFEHFTTAIDRCLDGLPTVHKGEMETLLTPKFQMFGDVPLLAA
jgi:hypothetical protein